MSDDARKRRAESLNVLPPGTRLGELEVLSVLGVGGFGIVYLTFDHSLEREVAVKEYMPAMMAGRTASLHVSLRSPADAATFTLGLRSFLNEARLLARFDHPSLLKVMRFWEANGTAYMAMPVLRGRTLRQSRLEAQAPPDERRVRELLDPLLGAIATLHEAGVYHRDIAPDNIHIEPDGRPVLLDFGAARRVIGDRNQSLTAILKPAYAPIEQYGEGGHADDVRQGPWTDLYSLGATLHFLLLARPPAPAPARVVRDGPSALTVANLPEFSAGFLRTIDWMLSPRPGERPQSVEELREALATGRRPPPPVPTSLHAADDWERTVLMPRRAPQRAAALPPDFEAPPGMVVAPAALAGSAVPAAAARPLPAAHTRFADLGAPSYAEAAPPAAAPSVPAAAPTRMPLVVAAGALLALALGAAWLWAGKAQAPRRATESASVAGATQALVASPVAPMASDARPESAVATVVVEPRK